MSTFQLGLILGHISVIDRELFSPENVTDFCRDKIFSLTTEFNAAAFSCDCNPKGSESFCCDEYGGQCKCKANIIGRRCDRCAPGYYNYPDCIKCKCSIGQQCDEQTGQCFCPPHVEGTACDKCSSVDMSMFTTNDPAGTLEFDNDIVTYTAGDNSTASVYFNVPIEHGADYTTSYGLLLYFQLSVQPRDDHPRMSTDADVRLHGNNMTAEFWAPEQPADPKEAFNVRVKLVPENFLSTTGEPITRDQLMMILHSLQNITIKASYYSNPSSAQLIDFGLEVSGEVYALIVNTALTETIASCVKRDTMEMPPMAVHTPVCHASVHFHPQTTLLLDARCDAGFFGEPQRPGGSCRPCDCNDNNNLTDSRACHPITGDCYLCERNTDGRHCEYCAQWYHGDAVAAKNCTACTCDQCGSAMCDNQAGDCQCKPNVEGLNCDRCISDHWGFSRCGGCYPCHCGIASSSTQCDDETGQCQCRPGAVGLRCEHCEHGFWNYGEYGCQKCDCEADLSMGTVCDVRTGQCHCQEGATGARCDQCLQSYLRIPTFGCRRCDECVHHLVSDVDHLGLDIQHLNMSIGNISSATVVGARLSRNSKNVNKYTDIANLLSGEQYDNFIGDARAVLANMSQLMNSVERSNTVADNDVERAMNLTDSAGEVIQDIRRRAADASASVDHAKNLVASLGSHSSALIIDPRWVEYAEETLHELEAVTADGKPEEATRVPKKIAEVQEELSRRTEKLNELNKKLHHAQDKSEEVADYLSDSQKMLKESRKNSEEARKAASGISTLRLEGLGKALADGRDKAIEEHSIVTGVLLEVKNLTEQAKDALESVGNSLTNLAEVRAELAEMVEPKREKRQASYDKGAVDARVRDLEIEASRLKNNFGSAQLESQNAVEAATAYSNLTDSLKSAQENAQWAINEMTELSEGLQEKKEQVKQALNGSATLVRQASNLQQNTLNTLKKEAVETENRIDRLTTMVDGMRRNVDGIRASLLSVLVPKLMKSYDNMHNSATNRTAKVEACVDKIAALKEQIAVARDAANRIKLGAHFEQGSSLDLAMPHRVARSAAHTDISFHFRTAKEHGIPLFFGNEEGSAGTRAVPTDDYIAVEIEYGQPKVTINLGEKPLVIRLNT
ncbi:laminin EGF-like protein [Teladorsagia circumcincta]|uniref:Laminin EGF-like protein n=1 Tax=Teladorsagia circumcincta TaxID=45464 RepID=A0A2G9U9V0_TELCI|nr:laminin EGF-like protein [Teladorsagia circumcincta]